MKPITVKPEQWYVPLEQQDKDNRKKAIAMLEKMKQLEAKAQLIERHIDQAKRLVTNIYKVK